MRMSAFGTKRTCRDEADMSAFGGKVDDPESGLMGMRHLGSASPTIGYQSFCSLSMNRTSSAPNSAWKEVAPIFSRRARVSELPITLRRSSVSC